MSQIDLCSWLQLNYPKLVKSMQDCSHHYNESTINPYHKEGNVWTHTCMVAKQAERYCLEVQIAAWLHDIGKPMVMLPNHEKQRNTFVGHESASAILAPEIIDRIVRDFNVNVDKRVIIEMIALHLTPYHLSKEELTSRLVNNSILKTSLLQLADADHNGRFGIGERVTDPSEIPDTTKGYEKKEDRYLYILIGLPNSGKSSYVNTFINLENIDIISRDSVVMELGKGDTYDEKWKNVDQKKVDSVLMDRFTKAVKGTKDVVIDMTNLSRKSRRKWLCSVPKTINKRAIVFFPHFMRIIEREYKRSIDGKSIPDHVYDSMCKSFSPPMYDEFDTIDWLF